METHASLRQSKNADFLPHESADGTTKNSDVMDAKAFVELSPPPHVLSNGEASLGPITPDSNKESADIMSNFTSPLTTFSSPPRCFDSHSHQNDDDKSSLTENTPCTPKEGVFDPFAPGPNKLMLAPHCTKYLEESRSYVVRRLNFRSSLNVDGEAKRASDETISDEDMLLETVYDTLLEAIISKQTEEILSEISFSEPPSPDFLSGVSSSDPPSPDGFKTPPAAPRLNWIVETCPGPPLKPARKLRNIDLGLCKRLEF